VGAQLDPYLDSYAPTRYREVVLTASNSVSIKQSICAIPSQNKWKLKDVK